MAIILTMVHPGNIFLTRKNRVNQNADIRGAQETGTAPFDAMPAMNEMLFRIS